MNLRGAVFRNARLGNAVLRRIDLDDADFAGADLLRTELNRGQARGARFDGAVLTGTVFRDLDLTDAAFAGASPWRARFLRCVLPELPTSIADPPKMLMALCESAERNNTVTE